MNITYVIVLVIVFFCIFCYIIYNQKKKNKQLAEELQKKNTNNIEQLKQFYRKETEQEQEKLKLKEENLNQKWAAAFQKHQMQLSTLNNEIKKYESILEEKELQYDEINQDLDLYRQGKIKEIDGTAAEYEKHQQTIISNALKDYRAYWTDKFNEDLAKMAETRNLKLEELAQLNSELEEERRKRQAINEEILRQRALDEQQDFYKIQISEEDKRDIDILKDIVPRLRRPDAVSKIIWTNYYQKPLAELRNRVAIEGPGVYKITRIKTGEIYIGQAVNVSTRWTEHCKTALGIGSLASSQLHRVMKEDGCENFTFELLEEVPKEKLRERESYYIDFYDSKKYGLNTISGDKK